MRALLVAACGVGTALVAVPTALGAEGRLLVPKAGASVGSKAARVVFDLAADWTQATGLSQGTPRVGVYQRRIALEPSASCVLELEVTGAAVSGRARYRHGRLHVGRPASFGLQDLHVAARGHAGSLRWYRGPVGGEEVVGAAVLPTPPGLAPARLRRTVVRGGLTGRVEAWAGSQPLTATAQQADACKTLLRTRAPTVLRAVLPAVRVQRKVAA